MTSHVAFMLCDVLYFFTLRPSDLIITLTYVVMDNFCPCFLISLIHIANNDKAHEIERI